jgi:hypothetical protein
LNGIITAKFIIVKQSTSFIFLFILLIISINLRAQISYQWAHAMGGSGIDYGQCIVADHSGNVYVAGVFNGQADFDPSTGLSTLSSNSGSNDIFLAKYDAAGSFLWVKQIAGSSDEKPFDMYLDAGDNIYLSGIFKGTVDFDPGGSAASITYNGGGTDGDGFFAKYDHDGNYVWAFKIGGSGNDRILGITGDKSGNIYICGFTSGTVDMNPGTGTANLVSTGYNSFFAKYSSSGTYAFAKQLSGAYSEVNDIRVDSSFNIFIAGDWSETVDFDPGTATVNMSTGSAIQIDAYMGKYNSSGQYVWAKRLGGTGVDYATQINFDVNGNIYLGGLFSSTSDFDPGIAVSNMISAGGSDVFYARYDNAGNYLWANRFGGSSNDYLNSLAMDNQHLFITGKFSGSNIDFDAGTGTSVLSGSNTAYFAQYDLSGNYLSAYTAGTSASEGKGLYLANSELYVTGSFQSSADFDFGAGIDTKSSSGSDDIFVAKYNSCAIPIPSNPATIFGLQSICPGSTISYHISPVNNATSYSWALPSGWTGSSNDTIISITADTSSGIISVSALNACGSSVAETMSVHVIHISGAVNTSGVKCYGQCNGSASIAESGGISPYTYFWSNGETTQSATNLCQGVYSLTVTDSMGCVANFMAIIAEPLPVSVTHSAATSICYGSCAGLNANASGGTGPITFSWQPGNYSGASVSVCPLASTTFTLTATDTNTCYISDTITVSVNSLPVVSFNLNVDTVCVYSASMVLNTGSPSGGIYTGTGVNSGIFDPSISGYGMHEIVYTYSNPEGCTDSASAQIFVDFCTGINLQQKDDLKVESSPNPFSDFIKISNLKGKHLQIKISSIIGLEMQSEIAFENDEIFVNTSLFPKGVYLIRLQDENRIEIIKMIK